MIHIVKDLTSVPENLKKHQKKFNDCIKQQSYTAENAYKVVREDLKKLYHDKCAYCEDNLKNSHRNVEHYRPKQKLKNDRKNCDATHGYYWMGLSWSNLILSCSLCNSNKSSCFDIQAKRVKYNGEAFDEIHKISKSYHQTEKPLLIHPEIDNPEPLIYFNVKGEPYSKDKRMKKTIEICKLDREDLVELRMFILNEFRKKLTISFNAFQANSSLKKEERLIFFKAEIEDFFCKANSNKSSFTAWRRYILKNYQQFLFKKGNDEFNTIIGLALFKYRVSYCENIISK